MSRRVTVACPYQHGLHRISHKSTWSDLNRRSRAPEARAVFMTNRGQTFLHADLRPSRIDVPFGTDDPRERKNTQRELNPHFRPGEAAGCRYIMGANTLVELPKSKTSRAPGGTRTHVSALRVRSPGRWTTCACSNFSGIGRARTVTNRVRTGCAASLTPRSQMDSSLRGSFRESKVESRPSRGGTCAEPVVEFSTLDFLLSTLYSPKANGAGGIRTPAVRVKSSLCCRYTTTPCEGVVTFKSELMLHVDLLLQSLGMELNHRSRHIRTMCFRDTTRRSVIQ